jgi:hypothetical protein
MHYSVVVKPVSLCMERNMISNYLLKYYSQKVENSLH